MEENQTTSLFGLSIDPTTKAHLYETAKWARFLAILGFVVMGLIVLLVVFAGTFLATLSGGFRANDVNSAAATGFAAGFQIFFVIIMALLYFFPLLFLLRFANQMKTALAANDQDTLNSSFQNLKRLFRFIGILTIIALAFYAIIIFIALIGAGIGR